MRNIAINQYKIYKSTLKIPNNLIIYLTSRYVFKMKKNIEKPYHSDPYMGHLKTMPPFEIAKLKKQFA